MADPSTDLAVMVAIAASYSELDLPSDVAFVGEVGLGGEIRQVPQVSRPFIGCTSALCHVGSHIATPA